MKLPQIHKYTIVQVHKYQMLTPEAKVKNDRANKDFGFPQISGSGSGSGSCCKFEKKKFKDF